MDFYRLPYTKHDFDSNSLEAHMWGNAQIEHSPVLDGLLFSSGLYNLPLTPHATVVSLFLLQQGHQELSGKSDENKSFKSNQLAPSIYIMIELCFFSLDQWEIRIHLLWGKCFNIPHHCDPHLNQTKWLIFNDLLPLTIPGVLGASGDGRNLDSKALWTSEPWPTEKKRKRFGWFPSLWKSCSHSWARESILTLA